MEPFEAYRTPPWLPLQTTSKGAAHGWHSSRARTDWNAWHVIKVQTSEGSVELDDEDRFLLRGVLREINQASYLFEGDAAWTRFPELLSAVRAERTSPDVRVEIRAAEMEWLGRLAYRTCEHLGPDEFSTRTGRTLQEAQDLLFRLTRT